MFLLGSMVVSDYTVDVYVNVDVGGFQYAFIDVIVEGYTGNKMIQVAYIPPHVLAHVKVKNLDF